MGGLYDSSWPGSLSLGAGMYVRPVAVLSSVLPAPGGEQGGGRAPSQQAEGCIETTRVPHTQRNTRIGVETHTSPSRPRLPPPCRHFTIILPNQVCLWLLGRLLPLDPPLAQRTHQLHHPAHSQPHSRPSSKASGSAPPAHTQPHLSPPLCPGSTPTTTTTSSPFSPHSLLLLPLGRHKASLGLGRPAQRHHLHIPREPVHLGLKGVHLHVRELACGAGCMGATNSRAGGAGHAQAAGLGSAAAAAAAAARQTLPKGASHTAAHTAFRPSARSPR